MELLHILDTAVSAVVPVVLLVALGYILRQTGFLTKEFIKVGNKLTFNVLIPCMLFINVYNIESFSHIRWGVVVYSILMIAVIFTLGLITAVVTTKVPQRRGVILQGTFRSNMAIVGLSLSSVLGGAEAVAVASIVSAFTIPVMNILAVISLTIFVDNGSHKIDVKGILKNIARNPIILGISVGMVALLIRALQVRFFGRVVFALNVHAKFLYNVLTSLKSMTSPLALIVLGGQFDFSSSRGMLKEIVVGTAWRVVIAPVLTLGTAVVLTILGILDFGVNDYPALIALFGTPTAVSSAIMAGQMKNDEQLATQLVVWTSLFSIATMFITVCILMAAGLLAA